MQKTIKALRPLGFTNHSIADLKKLSRHQIYRLKLKFKEFKHYIEKPSEFAIKRPTKGSVKALKKTGFKVSPKGRALIPLKGNTSVKLSGSKLIFTDEKRGRRETVFTAYDVKNFRSQVQKAIKQHQKTGGLFGFKIGDNAMASSMFVNVEDMNKYLVDVMLPKMNISAEQFLPQISIVLFNPKFKK